jgi:ABC-type multidrug transport system fused ATPase/permease subunit
VIVLLVALILKTGLEYTAQLGGVTIQEGVARDLRMQLLHHLQALPLTYFHETKAGQTVTRLINDANQVKMAVNTALASLLYSGLMTLVYVGILLALSVRLTLLIMGGGTMLLFITRPLSTGLRRHWRELAAQQGELTSMVDEMVGSMKLVRAYGAETFEAERFEHVAERYREGMLRVQRFSSLWRAGGDVLGGVMIVLILLAGTRLALVDPLTLRPEVLITFLVVSLQLMPPLKTLSTAPTMMSAALASADRVSELLETPPDETDERGAAAAVFHERIEYRRVSFGYRAETAVLRDVDLEVARGQTVAIVGPSGAGKTTLVDLLPRFYEPTAGEILLDGVPIARYTRRSLRSLMGIVSQEPILLHDTVFANIAYGRTDFSREQVRAAARTANADDFISRLPKGYDTRVGERGIQLSGGQRQRIAIARAMLRDPPILILDEATNQLDSESERLVQDAIDRLIRDRTVLVIAHRLATVLHADLILVVSEGRIIERGTHEALLAAGGHYGRLYDLQFRPQGAGDRPPSASPRRRGSPALGLS